MIKFWEKNKSIPIKGVRATIVSTIILLIIGGFLIYCAVKPPTFFPFLKDVFNRIIYVAVGLFIIYKALKLFFSK